MKTVVNPSSTEVVVNNIRKENYYGVQTPTSQKGFILRKQYRSDNFHVVCPIAMTEGNSFLIYEEDSSLVSLVKKILALNGQVFEFDSYKELFEWLAQ